MIKKWHYPTIVTLIIFGCAIGVFIYLKKNFNEKEIIIDKPLINQIADEDTTLDLKTIIHEANKSVVQIEAITEHSTLTGSGFLFNDQGDIITNAHVIKDANYIYVRMANANIYPAAVVNIGEDIDIAVIRVPELANEASLTIEAEKTFDIGDEIIALGSPHGFQNTVTIGIISGIERNFIIDGYNYDNVIQISAQILQGNSGGPLIQRDTGKVIGINSIGTGDGTLGFSIPLYLVHDQIHTWSNEVPNSQLSFPETDDIVFNKDANRITEDAEYLVEYFFESLSLRDYISAYTLLGSSLQQQTSYPDFRDQFISIVDLKHDDITIKHRDNQFPDEVTAKVKTYMTNYSKDDQQAKEKIVHFKFTIGLENDQLKILTFEQDEVS